jgi:hypothetical protein
MPPVGLHPSRAHVFVLPVVRHREAIAAMDFFTVPTLTFRVRCCLFILGHEIQLGFRPVARILQFFWESIAQQKMYISWC